MRTFLTIVGGLVTVLVVVVGTALYVPSTYGWAEQAATVGDVFTAISAVVSGLAFIAIAVTIVIQGQQLRSSSHLAATAILFEYYNEKISSLREAIAAGRNVDENKRKVEALLQKHETVLQSLERQYYREIGS